MKILFISDLHLGDGSKADDFGNNDEKILKWFNTILPDKIYIVGDAYEQQQFKMKNIIKAHPKLYKFFQLGIFDSVKGNHDYKLSKKDTIKLKYNDIKILVSHGHQADKGMSNPLVRGFVWFLGIIERLPFMSWVDNPEKFSKKPNRADYKTEEYAEKKLKKYNIVICGHTHKKLIKNYSTESKLKIYANCGTCMHGKFEGILYDTEYDRIERI